jgi:hypothetical protein
MPQVQESKKKYKKTSRDIRLSQKQELKNLGVKKGYRVFCLEELDVSLIHNYEYVVSSAEKLLKKDSNFHYIFNTEGDVESEGYTTSKRQQLNLNVTKYDRLVEVFRKLDLT